MRRGNSLKNFWHRLSFAVQMAVVFILISIIPIIALFYFNFFYVQYTMETKVSAFADVGLRQSAQNISTMLKGYENSALQMIIDKDFILHVKKMADSLDSEAKTAIKNEIQTFLSYRPYIRSMAVQSLNGETLCFDRLKEDSLYQQMMPDYDRHFAQTPDIPSYIKSEKWINTDYADSQGNIDYYLFAYRQNIIDIDDMKKKGTFIMSIDEQTLSEICQESSISSDTKDNFLFITASDGTVLSHYDKSFIGKNMRMLFASEEIREQLAMDSARNLNAKLADGSEVLLSIETIPVTGWKIINVLNWQYVTKELRATHHMTTVILLALIVCTVIAASFVARQMSKSVKLIVHAMYEAKEGTLSAKVKLKRTDKNEITLIGKRFNEMMETINRQMDMVRQSAQKEKEAEIHALEAQINPHFIYNTLDSINWVAIENNQPEISRMLSRFAMILRYQINNSNVTVSIGEELNYLEMYLYLQKSRFSDRFEYMIDVDEDVKKYRIHKMLFQPFIENAIIHGHANMEYGGIIKIAIHRCGEDRLVFSIVDNGKGMEEEKVRKLFYGNRKENSSIGISNVLSRLEIYYGDRYTLNVKSRINEGTKIDIVIPVEDRLYGERGRQT